MIIAKELTKIFITGDKKLVALDNLDFHIPKQQFVAVTGKSGSGKSTLLYQLSLLDTPTKGEVILNRDKVMSLNDEEKVKYRLDNLGYIFQDYAILPMLTAKENVMMPLLMQNMSQSDATEKAIQALERVGLGDRIDNLPSQLSGGQQQRVSIARSVVHEPIILFADEPTANLDSESSEVILDVFKKLHKDGQTIVMVTHEREYAELTERIITLSDGKIVGDKILKKPKKRKFR